MSKPSTIPLCRPFIPPAAEGNIAACLDSGWLGYGPLCHSLERRFEARGGAALATANCSAALHLAARLCARPGRNRLLVPAITFVSTAMAPRYAGLEVELVDVDPHSGLLDPESVARSITPDTCAVFAVHLFGQRAPVEQLRALCDEHELYLVEDCAHRLDLLDPDPPLGDMACYSFNAVKEAPGGEGGLLWCRNAAQLERARAMSNLGLTIDTPTRASTIAHGDYAFGEDLGLKLRGFDLSVALILPNLDCLAEARAKRRSIFESYDKAIGQGGLVSPLARGPDDSRLMYVVRVDVGARAALRSSLAGAGIATSIHYPSLSRHARFGARPLAHAEALDGELLTLPCFPDMSERDLERVTAALDAARSRPPATDRA